MMIVTDVNSSKGDTKEIHSITSLYQLYFMTIEIVTASLVWGSAGFPLKSLNCNQISQDPKGIIKGKILLTMLFDFYVCCLSAAQPNIKF